jgi:hypothetical protein
MINLNDQLATANGVAGGKETINSAGLIGTSTVTSGSCSTTFTVTSPSR